MKDKTDFWEKQAKLLFNALKLCGHSSSPNVMGHNIDHWKECPGCRALVKYKENIKSLIEE